jgi:hypothetical protein
MGFITLAEVEERQAKKSESFEDRVKADWVKVEPDSAIKITPLQELDEDSPNYSEKMGKAKFALEHSHPDNFKKKAQCTEDEGECFGCSNGWYQKVVLYINVLVDNGSDKPFPAVWSRGVGKNSVAQQLKEIAADEDFGFSITDKSFKLTRKGGGNESSYTLAQLPKTLVKDVEAYADSIFPLEKVVFYVSPERQEAYYLGVSQTEKSESKEPVSAGSVDSDW